MHTPPPVHGSSMVGEYISKSELINTTFDTQFINLGTSAKIDEIGKGSVKKLFKYFGILWETIYHCIFFSPQVGYLAMTAKGGAFFKDVLVGFLLKFFGVKLVIHFHNKGVSVNQHKKIYDLLYKKIFKNSKVILLSKYLYLSLIHI